MAKKKTSKKTTARKKAATKKKTTKKATDKHAGGRPRKYTKVEAMKNTIDLYFKGCYWNRCNAKLTEEEKKQHKPELLITEDQHPTISGLALALDLTRQSLLNYEEAEDAEGKQFFDTIKKAKARVEAYNEQKLYSNANVTGVIFNLKNNFNWADKTESDVKERIIIEYEDESV